MAIDIEHPDITNARLTGHDRETWQNMQRESNAKIEGGTIRDYYGDAIDLKNDHYVVIPTGYKILHRNLQKYLEERKGFEFNYIVGD